MDVLHESTLHIVFKVEIYFVYCKSVIWCFVGIITYMSAKIMVFLVKKVVNLRKILNNRGPAVRIFTCTLDDELFCIRKKELHVIIMRTVRYFFYV